MQEFSTRSVALVAAFRLNGVMPISVGDNGAGRRVFYFARTEQVTALLADYHADALTVTARAFASAMHEIRQEFIHAR